MGFVWLVLTDHQLEVESIQHTVYEAISALRTIHFVRACELRSACTGCREPRGIGFIEYTDARDAEDAIYGLDRKVIQGKEVSIKLFQCAFP